MIRLLVTLNVMLIFVAVTYTFFINTAVNTVLQTPIENHYQRMGKGTLQLLNEAVDGLNPEQRQEKLNTLRAHFIYPLNLRQFSELNLTDHEQKRLMDGLVIKRDIDGADHLYAKLPDTNDWVWEFALDLPKIQDEANTSAGTYYLLQQELAGQPPSEWPVIIERRQQQFGFPVVLHDPGTLTFTKAEQTQLDTGRILVVVQDEHTEIHYQRVGNSDSVLQLGAFGIPEIGKNLDLIVPGVFLLIVMLASYFWIGPLWRNLMQIKAAAEAFGNGEYDTRVPHHKRSRLAVITQAFNAMAERTQHSIRAQKELTGAVSHELRTPVARMRFSLDMLAATDNNEDRQRYISNMNQDIDELNDLLEEMLTYARLDQSADPITMSNTFLTTWFSSVMGDLERLADKKILIWRQEGLPEHERTLMSPVMMNRVVNNLVQNALRFAESRVEVVFSKDGDDYLLQVDDDGPGIPEAERERLFEAFAIQDNSRNKSLSGFGLGLAIVKRIIEGHHGQVSIETAELGGARFLVRWRVSNEMLSPYSVSLRGSSENSKPLSGAREGY